MLKRILRSIYILFTILSAGFFLITAQIDSTSVAIDPPDDDQTTLSDLHSESHGVKHSAAPYHITGALEAADALPVFAASTLYLAFFVAFVSLAAADSIRSRAPPLFATI